MAGPKKPTSVIPLETSAGPIHVGWFSKREKIGRLLWAVVKVTLYRWSFRRADSWRAFLLRRFGAKIGKGVLIRSNAHIEIPWNLVMGDHSQIGERAIIYNLSTIEIGDWTIISQYAHLCGGSHDHHNNKMMLHRMPIRIGSDVWICTDVYVGPGVVIGDGVLVGARSNVTRDLPPWKVCVGSPAKPIRDREYERLP
jgi:putative colanic acid biosynthesis acetyltransferase WcaF